MGGGLEQLAERIAAERDAVSVRSHPPAPRQPLRDLPTTPRGG
jgi:hypothetical protein